MSALPELAIEGREHRPTSVAELNTLIAGLGSNSWSERRVAEDGLVRFGPDAIPALITALRSPRSQVRWGAAKVLGSIGSDSAASALATTLEDSDGGVRWLAADGLIAMGPKAAIPVLRELETRPNSPWLQEGAHHVLRALKLPATKSVIRALEGRFPEMTVPVEAYKAMRDLPAG